MFSFFVCSCVSFNHILHLLTCIWNSHMKQSAQVHWELIIYRLHNRPQENGAHISWNTGYCGLLYVQTGFLSCDQAALRTLISVHLSVCPSVCHTYFTMFLSLCHPEIFRSYYHWRTWYPCKRSRSKVKVTEVVTPFSRFQTLTPVWIHIWWWNDAQSLMLLRRVALLFFKVTREISRSHG